MSSAPTRGAVDHNQRRWLQRPAIANSIRILLFLLPIFVGWLAVRGLQDRFWTAPGRLGFALWVGQAIAVAAAASFVGIKLAGRLAPLTALFQLTLVFPDHAPSRLGIALRSGTVKKLAADPNLTGKSAQEAAEQAVALITQLGKHERLTRGHTERVRAQAELIGAEMGLLDGELQKLRWGVLLHDIGKLKVPAEILDKPGKLSSEEWAILREHPAEGARIVAPLESWLGEWVHAAGQHHERWDGGGYPNGLSGEEISLAGRITAVADAFDVITSKRSYKKAMSSEAAREELVRCAGNQFDPAVVRAALQVGLHEPKRLGLAGWVFELPAVARLTTAVPTVITTAVPALAASVSLAAVALTGSGADIPETPPTALAMASSASAEFIGATGLEGPDEGQPNFPATTIPSDVVIALPEEPALPAVTADTGQQSDTPIEPTETSATTTAPDPATAATELPSQDAASSTTTTPLATTSTVVPGPTTTQVNTRPTTTTEAPARPTTTTTTSTTTTTTAPPPPPLPTGTGIQVFTGANVPNDLTVAPFISTTTAFLVEEKQSVTLASSLSAIEVLQGQLTNGNYSDREPIPSGTTVCSWIVLFQTTERSEITPTIDFHLPIIGLERLPETGSFTSELALDNTIYGPGGIGRSDSYKVTGNRIELWLANSPNGIDQLRIITEC